MIFSNFLKNKKKEWEQNKQYLKSATDLNFPVEQIIYIEGSYKKKTNKYLRKEYDDITSKVKKWNFSAEFVYLPLVLEKFQNSQASFLYFLNYYFPNIETCDGRIPKTYNILKTETITRLLFSTLEYSGSIAPGFLRYIGKNPDGFFIYEYFKLDFSNRFNFSKQIDYYISTLGHEPEFLFREQTIARHSCYESKAKYCRDLFEEESNRSLAKASIINDYTQLIKEEEKEEEKEENEKEVATEYELIEKIKKDIQNLKELGFYGLLIKEIGSVLFEDEINKKMFEPSRLVMDDEFKIYLPDFNNMEIEMTPLPKSLFILFLRHPQGIYLKSLIDYKKELLEIYKLLSYRETFFMMVESIDRICNPTDGSINEKLSRIKEAFQKKMSIDTAKHYIVFGDRGMKKKIELDRSLIELPEAFKEINLTEVSNPEN